VRPFSDAPELGHHEPVFTIGHSTHSLDRFLELLAGNGIEALVDVRLIPRSRRMSHFNVDSLAGALPAAGVRYEHARDLGGRRRPRADSPNQAWRVEGFRGYADYMETDAFAAALAKLEQAARVAPTAIMCAEGLWWRCHRRLISDALVVRGWRVVHIAPDGRAEPHALTDFAVVEKGVLTYPAPQTQLGLP
jgi:uncharacterized protein (DUF488 family)